MMDYICSSKCKRRNIMLYFTISGLFYFIIFLVLVFAFKSIYNFLKKNSDIRILNLQEYLPKEEIQTLKQVFFLIMMTLILIDIFYQIIFYNHDLLYFSIFDVCLSVVVVSMIKYRNWKSFVLIFLLMPGVSLDFLLFNLNYSYELIFLIPHLMALVYALWFYYNMFKIYTQSNHLSYTILLLFLIISVSLFFTSFVEHVGLLDALVMVSNAFTSNGYAVLGETIPGKINAVFLVWSGYILSGVGTATLTTALLIKYFNKKVKKLENKLDEIEKKLE